MTVLAKAVGETLLEIGLSRIDVKPMRDEIMETIKTIKDSRADGDITFVEIVDIFCELGQDIISVIKAKSSMSENELVDIVSSILKEAYFSEEGLNNPSLTFLPNWVEDNVEEFIFDYAIPLILKLILKLK